MQSARQPPFLALKSSLEDQITSVVLKLSKDLDLILYTYLAN